MSSLGDAAARSTGVVLVTQAVRTLLQLGSVVLLARILTPTDFGLVAMVTAVIGIADLLRDFGLSSAAVQSKTLDVSERTNLFWANLFLGLSCSLIAIAATPLIVSAYGEPRLTPIVLTLACVFTLSGANTQFRSDLTRSMRFGAVAVSDIGSQLAGIAVGVTMAVLDYGLWAIVAQQLTVAALSLVINMMSVRWLPGRYRRDVSLRRFFRFGRGLLGTQVIAYLTKNIDNVAIGAAWGAASLGLYSRAYQLLMMPLNQINAPMTNVALPVLSRVQHEDDTFARYLSRAQLVACYVTATLFAVAAGLASPLVSVLFGSRWAGVAPIFAVLALGGIFRAVSQIAYWIFLARGLTGAQLKQDLLLRPLMILALLAGLPWGPLGVAIGHSISYALYWIATLIYVGRVTHLDVSPLFANALRAITLVSVPAGLLAFLSTQLPIPPFVQILVGLAAAACFVGAGGVFVPPLRRDLLDVLRFVRRAASRDDRTARPDLVDPIARS